MCELLVQAFPIVLDDFEGDVEFAGDLVEVVCVQGFRCLAFSAVSRRDRCFKLELYIPLLVASTYCRGMHYLSMREALVASS